MAKRKFRIEGGNYGGECVIGEVKNAFVQQAIDLDEGELIDRVLEAEEWEQPEPADIEEHEDPEAVVIPRDDYYMWECDDIEHINGPYADGGFTVYEVPADGSDDYDYDKEIWSGEAIHMYGREGGYFGTEEPDEVTEELVPVLAFMSSEKGTFGVWFIEQDDDFDPYKLGFGVVETNLGEFVDRVYYDKVELDAEYDYNDTTGKYDELDEDYLNDFDDNAKWEREQNGE